MKAILSILLCILSAAFIGYYAYVNGCVNFNAFVGNTIIQIMGTIFAINIGVIPVLYYELRKVEKILGEDNLLKVAKSEIKQNAILMTIMMIIAIILSIIKGFVENSAWDYTFSSIILFMLFLTIFMVYDTVDGVLSLDHTPNQE